MLVDMRQQIKRMLPNEPLREICVTGLQRLDNVHVIDNRSVRPILFRYCPGANCANMHEQIVCGLL